MKVGTVIRLFTTALFILTAVAAVDSASDSADYLFRKGANEYDSLLLKKAVVLARHNRLPEKYLFIATCLWRIQIIKYVDDDKKGITFYGKQALTILDSAERNNEERYFVEARRAFVNQPLAGLGIKNGATFSPRITKKLKVMKKIRPNGFEVRLIEAINLLEMPASPPSDTQE